MKNPNAVLYSTLSTLAFVICILSANITFAQNIRKTDYGPDQSLKSSARVNPSTLAMEVSLPLGSFSGRGGNNIPLSISYSSKVWEMAVHGQWQNGTGTHITGVGPTFAKRSAGGWSSSLATPRIDYELQKYRGSNQDVTYEGEGYESAPWYPNQFENLFSIKRLRVTMPDGATHEFRASDTQLLCGNMNTGSCTLDQTGVYLSVDGSRMRLEVGSLSTVLYLPDGGRFVFAPGTSPGNPAHTFYDRNGNKMEFNTSSFTWTDTMGRSIPDLLPYNWNATQNQTVGDDQVKSYPGLAGNYNLKLSWHYLLDPNGEDALDPLLTQQTSSRSDIYCNGNQENSISGPVLFTNVQAEVRICELSASQPPAFNPILLTKVTLPNNQSYQFKYNYYGEITKITYPTGAYERFVYGTIAPVQNASPAYNQANRGVTQRYVSVKGDGTDEIPWSYSAGLSDGKYVVQTNAPDNSYTQQYLSYEGDPNVWRPYGFGNEQTGRSYEDRAYDSSSSHNLISRKLTEYTITGPLAGGWGGATRDMRPTKEVSIVFDPVNSNALATMTETVYDTADPVGSSDPAYFSSLNPKLQKTYNFVTVNASAAASANIATAASWFSSSTPAKISEMTYLYDDQNYKSRNITGLVTQTQVLDPTSPNIVKARSQFSYDDVNGVLLLSEPTSARWENPNTQKRGLVTKTKVWTDISLNQFSETNAQYDLMGNLRYSWDARNNLTQTVYSSTYDYAYPTSVITPIPDSTGVYGSATSLTTSTAYDYNSGLPTSTTDANNQTTTISYVDPATLVPDPLQRPRKVTAPNGQQTITDFGAGTSESTRWVKNRVQINASAWQEGTAWYDGLGRTIKRMSADPQGDVYALTCFDNMGRVSQTSNPFRNVSNPNCSTSLEWTTNTYDAEGRPWKVTTPDGSVVESTYSLATTSGYLLGTVVTVADPTNKQRRSITNALGQLKRVDEPTTAGNALGSLTSPNQDTRYSYDLLNNLTLVEQGVQQRIFQFDAMSRLTSATNPESGTIAYSYDNEGNLAVRTDARGASTHYSYDALNRINRRWHNGSSSPGSTTHNSPALPASIGTSFEAKYTYDSGSYGKGLLAIAVTGTGNGSKYREYTRNEYLNRDVVGRPQLFRQWITNFEVGAVYYDVNYLYDLAGGVTNMTYPSGHTVSYDYDWAGRLSSFQGRLGDNDLRTYADTFEYTPFGTIQQERFDTTTPLYHKQQFNSRGQIWAMRLSTYSFSVSPTDDNRGSIVNYYSSNFAANGVSGPDNSGNLLRQEISIPSSNFFRQNYTYDPVNRLKSVTEKLDGTGLDTFNQTFDYDRYGNRTINVGATFNAPAPQFNSGQMAAANRLYSPSENFSDNCSAPASTTRLMCYDVAGNLIRDKHVTNAAWMKYDSENKLSQHNTLNDQTDSTIYYYDADGKRKQSYSAASGTMKYIYGLGGELLYDAGDRANSKEYGDRNGQLLVTADISRESDVKWLVPDHLGTPRIVVDKTGNLSAIKRHDYLPFGEEIGPGVGGRTTGQGYGTPQADGVKQQFTSYERDIDTGLDFAQARYYGSPLGRFTSPDEFSGGPDELFDFADTATDNPTFYSDVENPQSLNKYQYTYNNPLNMTDRDGHCPICLAPAAPLIIPAATVVVEAFVAAAAGASGGAIVEGIRSGRSGGITEEPNAASRFSRAYERELLDSRISNEAQGGALLRNPQQPRNIGIQHPTRKDAKEAAQHPRPGKIKPTPPKRDKDGKPNKKRTEWEKQQKHSKYPERHPDSSHPDSHFHDSNKPKIREKGVNRHHYFPN